MKDFDTIHAKCRTGKTIIKWCSIFILSYVLHIIIAKWFGQYTQIEVWNSALLKIGLIYWGTVLIIIFLVIIKKRSNRYYIKCYEKIVSKNEKSMQYNTVIYGQSFLQKCFGIVTVKFYNLDCTEKIILKDVSKRILYYL